MALKIVECLKEAVRHMVEAVENAVENMRFAVFFVN